MQNKRCQLSFVEECEQVKDVECFCRSATLADGPETRDCRLGLDISSFGPKNFLLRNGVMQNKYTTCSAVPIGSIG
jgi:hypothetical protein